MPYPRAVPRLAPRRAFVNGVRLNTVIGPDGVGPSALTSTLTASASSFATDSSVTLTFTARDAASNLVVGYTPVPESGVVS